MPYRETSSFTLPGKQEPESDVRVVVQFVIDNLRKNHFRDDSCTPVAMSMSDTLRAMGFTLTDTVNLMQFMQKAGLLSKLSIKQGSLYLWWLSPIDDIMIIPTAVFDAAWREVKIEENLRKQVDKLTRQLRRGDKPTGRDEEFLAKIDAHSAELASQRDAALVHAAELQAEVERLRIELDARPDTNREVLERAFLARLDERLHGQRGTSRPRR